MHMRADTQQCTSRQEFLDSCYTYSFQVHFLWPHNRNFLEGSYSNAKTVPRRNIPFVWENLWVVKFIKPLKTLVLPAKMFYLMKFFQMRGSSQQGIVLEPWKLFPEPLRFGSFLKEFFQNTE